MRGFVYNKHARVLVFVLQVRGYEPHHCAERYEKDDLVVLLPKGGDFVFECALVGVYCVGQMGKARGKFGRGANACAG